MKGSLTEEERERLMVEANAKAEADRGHAWWVKQTAPQRKQMLRSAIRFALRSAGGHI